MDHHEHHIHDESWYKATWSQRASFAAGCATVSITLAKSALLFAGSPPIPRLLLPPAALLGYLLADLASGLYHWAIDNYGSANTPIFGPQIQSFSDHHRHPSEISKCETAGILHPLTVIAAVAVTPVNVLSSDPVLLAFVGVFAGCGMFNLKIHAWAHAQRKKVPAAVAALQEAGIFLRPSEHSKHHRPPYNCSYCTVSGVWNRALDEWKVLVTAEVGLFRLTGVTPRSWIQN